VQIGFVSGLAVPVADTLLSIASANISRARPSTNKRIGKGLSAGEEAGEYVAGTGGSAGAAPEGRLVMMMLIRIERSFINMANG
jgi:hypothetical protein